MGYLFKVIGIDTGSVAANVIQLKPVLDRPHKDLVRDAVSPSRATDAKPGQ